MEELLPKFLWAGVGGTQGDRNKERFIDPPVRVGGHGVLHAKLNLVTSRERGTD
jgi:hypothetical protein